MNNTILTESKIRRKLKISGNILFLFCLCFIFCLITVVMIERQNLSGQVDEVSGVLTHQPEGSSNTLKLDGEKTYNVVWNKEKYQIDWDKYQGKSITLTVTHKAFLCANPWALGLTVDGETIVDYNATLESQRVSNREMKTVVIAVTAVMCVGTCGVFIWRFNVNPAVERTLYHEFAQFISQRQPTCPKRKFIFIFIIIYLILFIALLIAAVVIDPDTEKITDLPSSAKAVLWTLLAVTVAGIAGLFALREYFARKEVDFYAENFPFDFSDISHAPIRKKYKEQLQQNIKKDREEHPDSYADGGNGYDVTFGEKGVLLTVPCNEDDRGELPKAEEVFAYNDKETQPRDLAATNNIFNINNGLQKNAMFVSYDQLNFEAVAHYRKYSRPLTIIIKSRLTKISDFPEEFVNDIHIAFDSNLHTTLQKYNVKVENLDYLLDNKKQLMTENCLKFRKKQFKNNK